MARTANTLGVIPYVALDVASLLGEGIFAGVAIYWPLFSHGYRAGQPQGLLDRRNFTSMNYEPEPGVGEGQGGLAFMASFHAITALLAAAAAARVYGRQSPSRAASDSAIFWFFANIAVRVFLRLLLFFHFDQHGAAIPTAAKIFSSALDLLALGYFFPRSTFIRKLREEAKVKAGMNQNEGQ